MNAQQLPLFDEPRQPRLLGFEHGRYTGVCAVCGGYASQVISYSRELSFEACAKYAARGRLPAGVVRP